MRRRSRHLRLLDKGRKRPKGPPPTDGWLLPDLAKLADIAPRAVRYYLQRGLLTRPTFRGTATRYGREQLLRLIAIRRFREKEQLDLATIKRRLGAMTTAELEAFATAELPPGPLTDALGLATESTATAAPLDRADGITGEPWERIGLLPGLELMVKADASPLVRRLVKDFAQLCRGTS